MKDDIKKTGFVTIDNTAYGKLKSLFGAMNLDAAKPWLDEAIKDALSSKAEEIVGRMEKEKDDRKFSVTNKQSRRSARQVRVDTHNKALDIAISIVRDSLSANKQGK